MKDAYVQLFWFKAEAGKYIFQKTNDSSLLSISTTFNNRLIPTEKNQFDLNNFSFELRKDLHPIYIPLLILSMLCSFFLTFGGLFLFLGAEKFSEKIMAYF